jgi:hypothetical protein
MEKEKKELFLNCFFFVFMCAFFFSSCYPLLKEKIPFRYRKKNFSKIVF